MYRSILVVLLFLLGVPTGLGAQPTVDAPSASGVYRPLNLIRQFKLGTSSLVNPSLQSRAEVVTIHALPARANVDAREIEILEKGVCNGTFYVFVETGETSRELSRVPKVRFDLSSCDQHTARNAPNLWQILRHGPTSTGLANTRFYIGSTSDESYHDSLVFLDDQGARKYVTWDPDEDILLEWDALVPSVD